jgi:ABC-type transport system involved in multi-copper enzyme maturation permease subunit
MLDLVWKDVSAARRFLWLIFPLTAVQIGATSFVPGVYAMSVLTVSALLAFGSLAVEEYHQTEALWNSLPVTRREFVAARYLTTLLGSAGGLALGWALAHGVMLLDTTGVAQRSALLGVGAHLVMLGALALAAAVYLPLVFRFGAGRALLYFSGIAVAALIVGSFVTQWILVATGALASTTDPAAWREFLARAPAWVEPRSALLVTLFLAAAALAVGTSMLVSQRVYATRDL